MRPPLSFNFNNVVQASYLLLQVTTVYAVAALPFSARKTRAGFLAAFYICVFLVGAESFCGLAGLAFPYSLILNNPGYGLWSDFGESVGGLKNPAAFSEPSFAGAYMIFFTAVFTAEYLRGRGHFVRMLLGLCACLAITSSGSIFALVIALPILFLRCARLRGRPLGGKVRQLAFPIAIIALPLALVAINPSFYGGLLGSLTVSKTESGSFLGRTTADLYGLWLLADTWGIGVGLGSSRSSSLFTTLISNVGVAGFTALAIFYWGLLRHLSKELAWLRWGAFALVLNMVIAVPDVTFPPFWLPALLGAALGSPRQELSDTSLAGLGRLLPAQGDIG